MKKLKIVITAGGTSEYIDKVRKITNSGTGKLGATITNELLKRKDIENIYYICTTKSIRPIEDKRVKIIEIINTNDLKEKVENILSTKNIDWFIHSMAVSDYYVDYVSTASLLANELKQNSNFEKVLLSATNKLDNSDKISSNEDNLILVLKQTPKIINLIKKISPKTNLIGFKLLENVSEEYLLNIAKQLRDKNKCEYVIANDLKNIKNGNHKAFLLDKQDNIKIMNGKFDIAINISNIVNN